MFFLVACSNDTNNDEVKVVEGGVDSTFIDAYIYETSQIDLDGIPYYIHGIAGFDEQIVFWYVDETPSIVIEFIEASGRLVHKTRIPVQENKDVHVGGLQITDEGNIDIVTSMSDDARNAEVFRELYSKDGELLSSQNISGIVRQQGFFHILNTIFDDGGNLALVALVGDTDNAILHLLANDGRPIGELQVTLTQSIAKLKDGRVAALHNNGSSDSLRVIDFSSGVWGETLSLTTTDARIIIAASASDPYDVLIDDGNQLIGYTLGTATQTLLFNWLETGINPGKQHHISVLLDGRILMLFIDKVSSSFSDSDWHSEMLLLTAARRHDTDDNRTILTLAGLHIPDYIYMEVAAFNRESTHYQIQINDYGVNGDWEAAGARLNVEIIAGDAPDILVSEQGVINPAFLVDLYAFIDSDPNINRTDFFPNILKIQETSEGVLPLISSSFDIRTVLTTRENKAQFEPFTFDTLFWHLEEADSALELGGDRWMKRDFFMLSVFLMSGKSFIDYADSRANFDSEEFINVLEIAARLPAHDDRNLMGYDYELMRLYSGQQQLVFMSRIDINRYYEMQAIYDDVVAIGMPTPEGGQHAVVLPYGIGISAASSHQDAAWSFIRRLLLTVDMDFIEGLLPLNIAVFDARIIELMTPEFWDETIPEIGAVMGEERPREARMFGGLEPIYVYAMTENHATDIRDIVYNASILFGGDLTAWMILQEEFQAFCNGHRSAAEAARIIQNRVQTYLNEQVE